MPLPKAPHCWGKALCQAGHGPELPQNRGFNPKMENVRCSPEGRGGGQEAPPDGAGSTRHHRREEVMERGAAPALSSLSPKAKIPWGGGGGEEKKKKQKTQKHKKTKNEEMGQHTLSDAGGSKLGLERSGRKHREAH